MDTRAMCLELWKALGRDAAEFQGCVDRHGMADTWAEMLSRVVVAVDFINAFHEANDHVGVFGK